PDTLGALLARQFLSDRAVPRSLDLDDVSAPVWPAGEEGELRFQAWGEGVEAAPVGEVLVEPEDGSAPFRLELTRAQTLPGRRAPPGARARGPGGRRGRPPSPPAPGWPPAAPARQGASATSRAPWCRRSRPGCSCPRRSWARAPAAGPTRSPSLEATSSTAC